MDGLEWSARTGEARMTVESDLGLYSMNDGGENRGARMKKLGIVLLYWVGFGYVDLQKIITGW